MISESIHLLWLVMNYLWGLTSTVCIFVVVISLMKRVIVCLWLQVNLSSALFCIKTMLFAMVRVGLHCHPILGHLSVCCRFLKNMVFPQKSCVKDRPGHFITQLVMMRSAFATSSTMMVCRPFLFTNRIIVVFRMDCVMQWIVLV